MNSHKNAIAAIQKADITSIHDQKDKVERLKANKEKLLGYVRDNVIGSHREYQIRTVYGEKPLVYCDYTASGKSLKFIEQYISDQVMPLYANTHTL